MPRLTVCCKIAKWLFFFYFLLLLLPSRCEFQRKKKKSIKNACVILVYVCIFEEALCFSFFFLSIFSSFLRSALVWHLSAIHRSLVLINWFNNFFIWVMNYSLKVAFFLLLRKKLWFFYYFWYFMKIINLLCMCSCGFLILFKTFLLSTRVFFLSVSFFSR